MVSKANQQAGSRRRVDRRRTPVKCARTEPAGRPGFGAQNSDDRPKSVKRQGPGRQSVTVRLPGRLFRQGLNHAAFGPVAPAITQLVRTPSVTGGSFCTISDRQSTTSANNMLITAVIFMILSLFNTKVPVC